MSNKTYDLLKWFALIFLPALITFAGVIMSTLNFVYTDTVLTILAGFQVFLGSILGASNISYNQSTNTNETNKEDY